MGSVAAHTDVQKAHHQVGCQISRREEIERQEMLCVRAQSGRCGGSGSCSALLGRENGLGCAASSFVWETEGMASFAIFLTLSLTYRSLLGEPTNCCKIEVGDGIFAAEVRKTLGNRVWRLGDKTCDITNTNQDVSISPFVSFVALSIHCGGVFNL